jgi:hypothetical protein
MKEIIRMNQLAGIITEGQARKMLEILGEGTVRTKKLVKENMTPDQVSMRVFLETLGINPADPMFRTTIKTGNIGEVITLIIDTMGDGDEFNPLDGVFTQGDFAQAAEAAQFSEDMIDDILGHPAISRLERG